MTGFGKIVENKNILPVGYDFFSQICDWCACAFWQMHDFESSPVMEMLYFQENLFGVRSFIF